MMACGGLMIGYDDVTNRVWFVINHLPILQPMAARLTLAAQRRMSANPDGQMCGIAFVFLRPILSPQIPGFSEAR